MLWERSTYEFTKVVCAECMKMCCLGGKNSVVKGLTDVAYSYDSQFGSKVCSKVRTIVGIMGKCAGGPPKRVPRNIGTWVPLRELGAPSI